MSEPFETKDITSLIYDKFPDADEGSACAIPTVTPTRTFLEKTFLLNEEFQKNKPRCRRMSRHLYDIERIMDTEYGKMALTDIKLYHDIVEHRRKFYHLSYVDYDKNYPQFINFVPTGDILGSFRRDYNENMVDGYIYGDAIEFDALLARIQELQDRFRLSHKLWGDFTIGL